MTKPDFIRPQTGALMAMKEKKFLGRVADLEDPIVFDGLITDVRPMGLLVEVPDIGIRGAVKREDLPGGRWRFEGHRGAWTNWEGQSIVLGMRLPLEVTGVDRVRRFVDFRIATGAEDAAGRNEKFNQPEMPVRKKKSPPKDSRLAKSPKPSREDRRKPSSTEETKPPGWKPFSKAKSGGKKPGQKKRRK